jgi:hypothetical protein
MSVRRHVAIVLALLVLAGGGAGLQVAAAQDEPDGTFRLVCPLH